MKDPLDFIDQQAIETAISQAEKRTSGEIRVHLEATCKEDVLDRAAYVFRKIGMYNTMERNGVLIYLALNSRKFAVIGDIGINEAVPNDFWDTIKDDMIGHYKAERLTEGLVAGVEQAGKKLAKFFPRQKGDQDELPNEISIG